jgi:hypothetical protein
MDWSGINHFDIKITPTDELRPTDILSVGLNSSVGDLEF